MQKPPEKRPALTACDVHAHLRGLYTSEFPRGAPHLFERLPPKLPKFTQSLVRERLQQILDYETQIPGGGPMPSVPYDTLEPWVRNTLAVFLNPVVSTVHLEIGRDSTLSSSTHDIAHFDTQQPIIQHEVIQAVSMERPEALERVGCVFYDADGTKTIVDCTSHPHAGKYLEAMAEFLCKPPPHVAAWLQENGLQASTYSYAGDEFVTIVRSASQPVTVELLNTLSKMMQDAMASDAKLTSFVSFDDERFIVKYDGQWSEEEIAALKRREPGAIDKLRASRAKLPERFIPSVSCGAETLLKGLGTAIEVHNGDSRQSLDSLVKAGFRLMVALADARLGIDKRAFRASLTDEKLKAFLLRNGENRVLMQKNQELSTELAEKDAALRRACEERDQLALQMTNLRQRYEQALRDALGDVPEADVVHRLSQALLLE